MDRAARCHHTSASGMDDLPEPEAARVRPQQEEAAIGRVEEARRHDQIRAAVERGRKWKNDLDIFVEACRKLPEIDIDLLREGKHPKRHVDAPDASSAMRPDDVRVIRELVMRLQDNGYLEDLELVYRSGRVKMSHGLGRDLIMPEEMQLLERLAGLDAMGVAG
jgi:hypothetical protein